MICSQIKNISLIPNTSILRWGSRQLFWPHISFRRPVFDKGCVLSNLGHLSRQVSGRGAGVASGIFPTVVPRFAGVGAAGGVFPERRNLMARRPFWVCKMRMRWESVEGALQDETYVDSILRAVSYGLNSYNVRIAAARRTACVGFLVRNCSRFYAQTTHFRVVGTEMAAEPAAPRIVADDHED